MTEKIATSQEIAELRLTVRQMREAIRLLITWIGEPERPITTADRMHLLNILMGVEDHP